MLRNIYDKCEYGDRQIAPLMAALRTELAAVRLLTRECLSPHFCVLGWAARRID
jgi:hypothetical protein